MKKIVKVTFTRHTVATADTPRLYSSIEYEIPYDSTEPSKETPLDVHLRETLNAELPEAYHKAAMSMVYGDLSSGGTLHVDDVKLTVEFRRAPAYPNAPV